jgi:GNAT superfamily N-acetyltransferase
MARAVSGIGIRFAAAEDVGLLLQLIRELAAYERAPDAVVATEDDLRRHGFGPDQRFEALLAFVDDKPAGFALFYPDFSTWRGQPGVYLEDLYVRDWARRLGLGRRLMARLAATAIEADCAAAGDQPIALASLSSSERDVRWSGIFEKCGRWPQA